jgi:hypothetical protein
MVEDSKSSDSSFLATTAPASLFHELRDGVGHHLLFVSAGIPHLITVLFVLDGQNGRAFPWLWVALLTSLGFFLGHALTEPHHWYRW